MSSKILESHCDSLIERGVRLIGLAGEKGSGKDSSANFIAGINLVTHNFIDEFHSTNGGKIEIGGKVKNINDIAPRYIKIYHFADYLKEIAYNLFGVSANDLMYNKEAFTRYYWRDMPGVITDQALYNMVTRFLERKSDLADTSYTLPIIYHKDGPMKVRELIQYVGTELFRKINANCFIEYLFNRIWMDSVKLAIIADARFINELDAIKRAGGLNIKLLRGTNSDGHASENDFKNYTGWDAIIDNRECVDIRCLNKAVYEGVVGLGVFDVIGK